MNARIRWVLLTGICAAFALRGLGVIDATSLWSDELYSVGKSFQPSYRDLLQQLQQDTHPPLYYSLLWLWGGVVGQTGISLRLLSWLMYLMGGCVMVLQTRALAPSSRRGTAMALAALMAFCSFLSVAFFDRRQELCAADCFGGFGVVVASAASAVGLCHSGAHGQPYPFLWPVLVRCCCCLGCSPASDDSGLGCWVGASTSLGLDCLRASVSVQSQHGRLDRSA